MTRTASARVAGVTFLAYIVVGILAMILHGKAVRGDDIVAQLASINEHASYLRTAVVLDLLCAFAAIVLGVTLYALTREQDPHLAMLGLVCRSAEGIVGGISVQASLGLLWAAKAVASNASNTDATNAIGSYLLGVHWERPRLRHIFRRRQHRICLALLERADDPGCLGVDRGDRIRIARGGVAASTRRSLAGIGRAVPVDSHGRLRDLAGGVADCEGRSDRIVKARSWILIVAVAAVFLASCGGDSNNGPPARTYVMGFSGFPPEPSLSSILQTIEMWSQRADAALMVNEVPWDSLLAGKSAESLIRNNQVGLAAYYRAKGLRIIASVDPTNGLDRASDSAPLKAAGHSLTEPAMQSLYVDYVVAMQTLVHPDYLGIASETNLIRLAAPDSLYQAVKHAANTAAPQILAADPTAKLFTTVQVEVACGRFSQTPTYQGIAQDRTDFPFMVVLGLSSYPYLGGFADPDSIPLDYYDRLDDGAPISMMVIEGGWASKSIPANTDETMQKRYIERHEAILDQVGAIGWFQITFTDIDLAAIGLPPSAAPFAYLGLVDVNLNPKEALSAWDAAYKRPKL